MTVEPTTPGPSPLPLSPGSTAMVEEAAKLAGTGEVDTGTLLRALAAGKDGVRSVSLPAEYGLTPEAIGDRLETVDRATSEGIAVERPEGGRWTPKAVETLVRAASSPGPSFP